MAQVGAIPAHARACMRARLKPAVRFHALRHTWASLPTMAGVPLLVVAKNLGHADTRMVERQVPGKLDAVGQLLHRDAAALTLRRLG